MGIILPLATKTGKQLIFRNFVNISLAKKNVKRTFLCRGIAGDRLCLDDKDTPSQPKVDVKMPLLKSAIFW